MIRNQVENFRNDVIKKRIKFLMMKNILNLLPRLFGKGGFLSNYGTIDQNSKYH